MTIMTTCLELVISILCTSHNAVIQTSHNAVIQKQKVMYKNSVTFNFFINKISYFYKY